MKSYSGDLVQKFCAAVFLLGRLRFLWSLAMIFPVMSAMASVEVDVANYEDMARFEIRISPGAPTVVELAASREKTVANDWLTKIVKHLGTVEAERKLEAARIGVRFERPVVWASVDSTRKYALVGFEDPQIESRQAITVVRLADSKILSVVKTEGLIRDFCWLPEEGKFAILEGVEHSKFTPWSILSAVSGHPIRKIHFRGIIYDVRSDSKSDFVIDKHLDNASGMILVRGPEKS